MTSIASSKGVNFWWARSKLTTAILGSQKPRTGEGELIKDADIKLGQQGQGMYQKLLKGTNKESPYYGMAANRVVCETLDIESLREALLKPDCDPRILKSHAITTEAHQCLVEGNNKGFLELRFKQIVSLENKWLASHGSELKFELVAPK